MSLLPPGGRYSQLWWGSRSLPLNHIAPLKATGFLKPLHEKQFWVFFLFFPYHMYQNIQARSRGGGVTSYALSTAGKAVIRKQLCQAPRCSNNATTICDEHSPGYRMTLISEGVRSEGGGADSSSYVFLCWIMHKQIMGGLLAQRLQISCKKRVKDDKPYRFLSNHLHGVEISWLLRKLEWRPNGSHHISLVFGWNITFVSAEHVFFFYAVGLTNWVDFRGAW